MFEPTPHHPSEPPPTDVFASADAPADAPLGWLTAEFDAQASRGDAHALDSSQREALAETLSSAWWRTAVESAPAKDTDVADILRLILPSAVRAATSFPHGGTVLALYLRNLVNGAWALSWAHDVITVAVDVACDAARDAHAHHSADAVETAAWRLLAFMRDEFRVETAMLTSRVDLTVATATAAADAVVDIVATLEPLEHGVARDAVLREATREMVYYRTTARCALLARQLLDGHRRPLSSELDDLVRDVEAGGFNQMDASELRTHIAAARALSDAADRDWLHIDDGRLRIVYSFGIRTLGHDDPLTLVDSVRERVERHRTAEGRLGGLRITDVRSRLDLSDVWQGTDSFGRAYSGATIALEPLTVRQPGTAGTEDVISPQIQLSHLGNHAILFDIPLRDVPAARVAETVSLATPVFGDIEEIQDLLELRDSAGTTHSGLAEIAGSLLDDLRDLLVDPTTTERRSSGSPSPHRATVSSRAGSFGVMVTVLRASRIPDHGPIVPLASALEMLDLWGAQPLIHPLPSGTAGIVEWSLYELGDVRTWPLLHLNSALLASNSNVSLLAGFASPDYALQEMESYLTFAHSLHGMYQGWQDAVRDHAESIAMLMRAVTDSLAKIDRLDEQRAHVLTARRAVVIRELDKLLRDIELAELEIRILAQSNEAIMLFIDSPAIVTSPPLRRDLDTVLRSNGHDVLREGITRAFRDVVGAPLRPLLDVVHRRLQQEYAAHTAALAEEQAAAQRREALRRVEAERMQAARDAAEAKRTEIVMNLVNVFAAVVGLSGLASILQAAHNWDGTVSWWLVAGILMVACAIGVLLSVLTRRRTLREAHVGRTDPRGSPVASSDPAPEQRAAGEER